MKQNNEKFLQYREQYPTIIYRSYQIEQLKDIYQITYEFETVGLATFHPVVEIPVREVTSPSFFRYLVFHLGMVELISYFKCTCSPNIMIEAGYLDENQMKWFQKLFYRGLGEFLYCNGITISEENLLHMTCTAPKEQIQIPEYVGSGNFIPIGGGKDSIVTMELLKEEFNQNTCFILNPKKVTRACAEAGGYTNEKVVTVSRKIDPMLLELNQQGFLNGHTPFSAMLAFLSYLVAYLLQKKYIILSNEASANEATVIGTDVNHQYSKSYEFENDFNMYTKKYFEISIHYFSLLRPLNELQIVKLFSQHKKYHPIFKSCNLGSKTEPWHWCGSCPKCLFIFIILSPYLTEEELVSIFGCNLFEKESLLPTFLELLGYAETKPFDCIGTIREVRYAVSKTIESYKGRLPYLLSYYQENYPLYLGDNPECDYNSLHNVNQHFEQIIQRELRCHDET